jgi:hypothetical protein
MTSELAPADAAMQLLLASTPASWPLTLSARLCDLRPRFIAKGCVGRTHRAIARNGRVLLASEFPLSELDGKGVQVRFQTWHKAILAGDVPKPYGILLVVRVLSNSSLPFVARLVPASAEPCDFAINVGGGSRLEFRRVAV